MMDDHANLPTPSSDGGNDLYGGALTRIRNSMLVLALALTIAAWWKFGRAAAVGFLLGCWLASVNFRWQTRGVSGLADRVTITWKVQSGKGIVGRFLFR